MRKSFSFTSWTGWEQDLIRSKVREQQFTFMTWASELEGMSVRVLRQRIAEVGRLKSFAQSGVKMGVSD